MAGNKGHHIRLSEETEEKLEELIKHFSSQSKPAEKAAIISQAIEEMHEKYVPKKVENFKIFKRIPFDRNMVVYVEFVAGKYEVFLLFGNDSSHLLNRIDLDSYIFLQDAEKMSELFPTLYNLAINRGFNLNGRFFINYDIQRRVHVSYAMDLDVTPERFADILDGKIDR